MFDIVFYIFAAICIISAMVVVFARSIAYAAFALLFTFFGVSGVYILLGADFVGVAQLLIYVGGILVLFLFGMMLTSNVDKMQEDRATFGRSFLGALVLVSIATMFLYIVWTNTAWIAAVPVVKPTEETTSLIGWLFMGDYALLFIASSIAILVALVGAAMIGRSDRISAEDAAERM
jgi:NADH-quinone oxidoreductase subunit J